MVNKIVSGAKEKLVFAREFIGEFKEVGAPMPTSQKAVANLVAPLDRDKTGQGRRIVELGAGTGTATVQIIKRLRPGDELVVCEINPRLMRELKKRLEADSCYQKVKSQVSLFLGPAQELEEAAAYDFIICAIPFLNLELPLVEELFEKIARLSHKRTVMTYYEYIGLRKLGTLVYPKKHRQRMRLIDVYMKELHKAALKRRKEVWLHLIPINVFEVGTGDLPKHAKTGTKNSR